MAKSKKTEETRTSIDNINDSLTALGAKVQKNQKAITIATFIIAAIVIAILVYLFLIRKPAVQRADAFIGDADRELIVMNNDSTALELYQEAANAGYSAGNRAKLMSAIMLYKDGKYEEALEYVKDYSAKDDVVGAAAYSLEGDCYVNLDLLDNAVSSFKKAISQSDKNPYYTPFFMLKLARVYRAQGNYPEAEKLYQQIISDYPMYMNSYGIDVEKELNYVKNLAEKK